MSALEKNMGTRAQHKIQEKSALATAFAPKLLLAAFLLIVVLTGGSSRAEVASLMILRPLAILFLFIGLVTITRRHLLQFRSLFFLAFATVVLCAFHLIPLPPEVWQELPGRQIIIEIDQVAGLEGQWRPLTMDPLGGYNALWSLAIPLAVLVLAVQLDGDGDSFVLKSLLVLGTFSAFVGLLQILGSSDGRFFLYRITHAGLPVGLFANRNHQAVLLACLVPMAAAWLRNFERKSGGSELSERVLVVGLSFFALYLTLMVLVTGSRAGLVAMALAIPCAAWVYGSFEGAVRGAVPRPPLGIFKRIAVAIVLLLPFAGLSVLASGLGRGLAYDRVLGSSPADELRAKIIPFSAELAQEYAFFGSGLGSFEPVFKIHEADDFLGPAYVNHVHNDFVEVAMTLGVPGVVLLLSGIGATLLAGRRTLIAASRPGSMLGLARASFVTLFLLAFASLWDYPLRVPSLQAVAVLAAVWLSKFNCAVSGSAFRHLSGINKSKGVK